MKRRGLRKGEVLLAKDTLIWQILETLSEKGPLNVESISKRLDRDYSNCHKLMRILQRAGYAEIVETRIGPKGQDSFFYDLTLKGLVIYLRYTEFQSLDRLAVKYAGLLPLVFGEWIYFETEKVKDIIVENFKRSVALEFRRIKEREDFNREFQVGAAIASHLEQTNEKLYPLADQIEEQTLIPWISNVMLGFWPEPEEKFFSKELQKAIRKRTNLWQYVEPKILERQKQTRHLLAKLEKLLSP